ncbi:MAG: hypothetical protein AB1486_05530 [Planctomycetota bacterium]
MIRCLLALSRNLSASQRVRPAARRYAAPTFFAALLILGLSVYDDYGLSWDEDAQRMIGLVTYEYVAHGNPALFSHRDREYGSAIELPLVALEKAFGLQDPRQVYLMRHLATFLLFYAGALAFYAISAKRFGAVRSALLACGFLVLSPRIFADAFYNTKDLAFLSLMTVAVYTLVRYHEQKTFGRALVHSLACALAIATRLPALLLPALTLVITLLDGVVVAAARKPLRSLTASVTAYLLTLPVFTVVLWPFLWVHPVEHFIESLKSMARYAFPAEVFYRGEYFAATEVPADYIVTWVGMTTPPLYLLLFVAGLLSFLGSCRHALRSPLRFYRERALDLITVAWLLAPVMAVLVFRSALYDGWRHLYFTYPAFILFAVQGLEAAFGLARRCAGGLRVALVVVLVSAVAAGLLVTAAFMVDVHPLQHAYFNFLAGDMRQVRAMYDVDYWGLSYRQGLEALLAHDSAERISYSAATFPGEFNLNILPPEDRARLAYVGDDPADGTYFLTNYRWHPQDYPFNNKVYAVVVGDADILAVFGTPRALPPGMPPQWGFEPSATPTTAGVWRAAALAHPTGAPAPGGWKSVPGERGSLTAGPYLLLPLGRYRVVFRIKAGEVAPLRRMTIGTLLVTSHRGIVVETREINLSDFKEADTYQDFVLEFEAAQALPDVEFRTVIAGSPVPVTIERVTLEPLP